MDSNIIARKWIQGMTVKPDSLLGQAFTGEEGAHVFRITGETTGGAAVPITGTIAAKFLRSDNITVPLSGSVSDGVAVVTLTDECYFVPGRFIFSIYVIQGDLRMCIYCGVGNIFRTDSGEYEGGQIITDITELKAEIQEAVESIPPDYSELTGEVADLKSAIQYTNILEKTIVNADIIQGSYGSKAVVTENAKRIRTQGTIRVMPGTTIEFTPGTNASRMIIGSFTADLDFISDSSWYTSKSTITLADTVERIVLAFRNEGNTAIVPSDFDATVVIRSNIGNYLKKHAPALQNGITGLRGIYPTITMNGSTAVVTFDKAGRIVWNNGYLADSNTSSQTYSVEQDKYLVYNTFTQAFRVESSTSNFTEYDIICLFNSHGALYGQWGNLHLAQKAQEKADITDGNPLPKYYDSYLSDKIATINTIGAALPVQSGRLYFITDYHIDGNENNSPALIRELIRKTGIKNIAFNGDAFGSETTAIAAYNKLCSFVRLWNPLEGESHVFYVTGNHEYNNPSSNPDYNDRMLTMGAISQLFNNYNNPIIVNIPDTNAFYYDDNVAKIRYYFIDATYGSNISLDLRLNMLPTLEEVPEGFAVLLLSHCGLTSDDSAIINRMNQIMSVCEAMNDGTSITIEYTSSIIRTYDFTNKARTFIGALTGHTHIDGYVYYNDRFPVIATMCDAHTQTYTSKYAERTAGTVNEQAFDVVQIDVPAKRIYMTRIGYGSDRTFSFGEIDSGLIS